MVQKEKQIENAILEYLAMSNIFSFKVKSQGTYDPVRKQFRAPSKYYKRGTADILGIYKGQFLAIEVKSEKGRASIHQKLFLDEVTKNGGIAFIARSVSEVADHLRSWPDSVRIKYNELKNDVDGVA